MSKTITHNSLLPASTAVGSSAPKQEKSAPKQEKSAYERLRALIVWLGLTELAWLAYWLLVGGGGAPGYVWTVLFWVAVMLVWMGAVTYLGVSGFFLRHTRFFSNLVGVAIVVTLASLLFAILPGAREGLVLAAHGTPDAQLAAIHILRLLAIGTVIKYLQGELPLHFVLLGSLPDVLFGISAAVVTALVANGPLDSRFLIAWHLAGFSVFIGAGVSMFFSVPSPLRMYYNKPDASIVFQFPMVLAPNFTVPLFMIAHLFALVKMLVG